MFSAYFLFQPKDENSIFVRRVHTSLQTCIDTWEFSGAKVTAQNCGKIDGHHLSPFSWICVYKSMTWILTPTLMVVLLCYGGFCWMAWVHLEGRVTQPKKKHFFGGSFPSQVYALFTKIIIRTNWWNIFWKSAVHPPPVHLERCVESVWQCVKAQNLAKTLYAVFNFTLSPVCSTHLCSIVATTQFCSD